MKKYSRLLSAAFVIGTLKAKGARVDPFPNGGKSGNARVASPETLRVYPFTLKRAYRQWLQRGTTKYTTIVISQSPTPFHTPMTSPPLPLSAVPPSPPHTYTYNYSIPNRCYDTDNKVQDSMSISVILPFIIHTELLYPPPPPRPPSHYLHPLLHPSPSCSLIRTATVQYSNRLSIILSSINNSHTHTHTLPYVKFIP